MKALAFCRWVGCSGPPAASSDVVARHCDGNTKRLPNNVPVHDRTGTFTSVSSQGFIDLNNEFFQDLGTNGRRCVSCHVPSVGWTITPHQLKQTFEETDGGAFDDGLGLGAVFRTNDGANSPNADVSTKAKRRQAYSMLLDKGLVRVGLPVPATAEFELVAVDDPYVHVDHGSDRAGHPGALTTADRLPRCRRIRTPS